jgi:hypothetical protein
MADNQDIAIKVKVEGVDQSIESVKDLKNAIRDAKDEQLKMASSFGQGSKQYQDATKKLSELKDKVEDLNDSTKSLKGTGVEQLTQGFSQMKEGIMNLDFEKVKGGIAAMKSGMGAFATAAKGALQGVKGALIATGIGALVVLLGTIVAYWDDIKGAINGVSKEQEKLNQLTKENYNTEKSKLEALNSQDNTLRLQGKSEKEILQIKIKQLDATYAAAEAQLNSTIRTQQAQEKASQRNKEILSGMLDFVNIPLTLLLNGVDLVGKALGQNFGLAEGFKKSVSDLVLGDDKELADKNKKELDAQVKTLSELKNQRAGYTLAINKLDDTTAKTSIDSQKEITAANLAAIKAIEDAKITAIKDDEQRLFAKEVLDNERRIKDIESSKASNDLKNQMLLANETIFQNNLNKINEDAAAKKKAIDDKAVADKLAKDNAELLAKSELDVLNNQNDINSKIALLTAKRDIELQNKELTESQIALINKKYADEEDKLREEQSAKDKAAQKQKFDNAVAAAQQTIEVSQQLSDVYFSNELAKNKGNAAKELEIRKKQFKVNQAFAISQALISGAAGAVNALSAAPFFPMAIIGMAMATLTTVASIAKIASTKFDGGTASGGGTSAAVSVPVPAAPTINTPQNNTNSSTTFDETGKKIGGDKTINPTIQVHSTVGVNEITDKSNRVNVLEQQSKF